MKYTTFLLTLLLLTSYSCKKKKEQSGTKKAEWIKNAFTALESDNYPRIKAISWWDENFDKTYLKVNSSDKSKKAYQTGVASSTFISTPVFSDGKLIGSTDGIYHAAYPDFGGTEDEISTKKITNFENTAGKDIAWAYFSNNWLDQLKFPTVAVNIIHEAGKTPFIRLMPRSNFDQESEDPVYTMQGIINGDFDEDIINWAVEAKLTNIPLLVEFGTEVNGDWFSWNGKYNGADEKTGYGDPTLPDGPERFKDAYRHIIAICNEHEADNITWFFHINADSSPVKDWNKMENYYPGDDYIDWLGISIYGAQKKKDELQEFSTILNQVYPRLISLSDKPIAILEFAITELD